MPRGLPPLTRREIIQILSARGFTLDETEGGHLHYIGYINHKRRLVILSSNIDEYSGDLLKSVIAQSGLNREEFYCSTKGTAKKINKKCQL